MIYRLKINLKKVENNEIFENIKTYKGWIDVTLDKSIVALYCATYNLKLKDMKDEIIKLLSNYTTLPLLKGELKNSLNNRGFSRLIAYILIREVAKSDKDLFDRFNEIYLS